MFRNMIIGIKSSIFGLPKPIIAAPTLLRTPTNYSGLTLRPLREAIIWRGDGRTPALIKEQKELASWGKEPSIVSHFWANPRVSAYVSTSLDKQVAARYADGGYIYQSVIPPIFTMVAQIPASVFVSRVNESMDLWYALGKLVRLQELAAVGSIPYTDVLRFQPVKCAEQAGVTAAIPNASYIHMMQQLGGDTDITPWTINPDYSLDRDVCVQVLSKSAGEAKWIQTKLVETNPETARVVYPSYGVATNVIKQCADLKFTGLPTHIHHIGPTNLDIARASLGLPAGGDLSDEQLTKYYMDLYMTSQKTLGRTRSVTTVGMFKSPALATDPVPQAADAAKPTSTPILLSPGKAAK